MYSGNTLPLGPFQWSVGEKALLGIELGPLNAKHMSLSTWLIKYILKLFFYENE